MNIQDLMDAFNSGLVKVGLRDGAAITGTVAVSNVPHVIVDTLPAGAVSVSNVPHVIVDSATMPTLTVNAHALTAGAATIGTVGVTGFPTAAAMADAVSNPTETRMGADNMVFNGTSWDRARGAGLASTTGDTGAKVASGNGATMTNVGNKGVQVVLAIGTVTGTTPTALFKIQSSVDGGTTWVDCPGASTASLTATGGYGIMIYPGVVNSAGAASNGSMALANGCLPRTWRVVWVIGGGTPSFAVTSVQYQYLR